MKWLIAIIIILAVTAGMFVYFNPSSSSPEDTSAPTGPLGGDRDEHGCIASAGYSWCESKQKCLRVWEEPCGTGQFCGGIAAVQCPLGYVCELEGDYPDAGGACQIAPAQKEPGIICIQVITRAQNDATGETRDFPTPCDLPEGWTAINQ